VKYAWIASNKAHWPITLACEVLGVSASGYFEHGRRKKLAKPSKPDARKRMSDEALLAHIRAIHAEVKGEYGWPKMWKELVARGHRVGKERVRRLMQLHGIRARCKRKFVVTTDSKHHLPIAPDLVQRNFTPTAPNQVWTGDITYIATDEGCDRPVQPTGGGLEHAASHAEQPGDRRVKDGMVPASTSARLDLPFGPRQPILRT
jgi:putative transposase